MAREKEREGKNTSNHHEQEEEEEDGEEDGREKDEDEEGEESVLVTFTLLKSAFNLSLVHRRKCSKKRGQESTVYQAQQV